MKKECRKCRQELELTNFTRSNIGKYGVNSTCKECQRGNTVKYTLQNKTPLKRSKIKHKYNPTGEKDLFEEIWNEREHICFDCGKFLREPRTWNFAHIKGKGSHPELRLSKDNILIKCFACHFEQDHGLKYKGPDLDL